MNDEEVTIEWLETVTPAFQEAPDGWTPEQGQRDIDDLAQVLKAVLGKAVIHGAISDCTHLADCPLPGKVMIGDGPACSYLTLSRFRRLFTISYVWDVQPEVLTALVDGLDACGFRHVPFTLFANPSCWSRAYDWGTMRQTPPPGWNVHLHEELWIRIFDHS